MSGILDFSLFSRFSDGTLSHAPGLFIVTGDIVLPLCGLSSHIIVFPIFHAIFVLYLSMLFRLSLTWEDGERIFIHFCSFI